MFEQVRGVGLGHYGLRFLSTVVSLIALVAQAQYQTPTPNLQSRFMSSTTQSINHVITWLPTSFQGVTAPVMSQTGTIFVLNLA